MLTQVKYEDLFIFIKLYYRLKAHRRQYYTQINKTSHIHIYPFYTATTEEYS